MKSKTREIKKLEIIIEKNDGLLWGRVEMPEILCPRLTEKVPVR